jgi:predicted PurR-regulated permease PerM
LRAQLLQCVLFGAGVWMCLAVAHVSVAPLVGLVAGALLLVPVIGGLLAIIVPLLAVAVLNTAAVLPIAVALIVLEQLVLNVVGPRIMSRQLGLPPLLVLFAILAGGQVAGVWGAVFGIPVLATLLTCADHFRARWSGVPARA